MKTISAFSSILALETFGTYVKQTCLNIQTVSYTLQFVEVYLSTCQGSEDGR